MLDTFDSIGPADVFVSGLGRLFLGSFIMLFSYAVLNVFISIISQVRLAACCLQFALQPQPLLTRRLMQAWEEVHHEAKTDGSPPDQLLPDHRRSRGRRLHSVGPMNVSADDDLRTELQLSKLAAGLESQLMEVRAVVLKLQQEQAVAQSTRSDAST